MKMGNWNAEAVKKEPAAPKVKVESSPASDMSAYYSDDNSDDDFKRPTKKRTKVFFFLSKCVFCLYFFIIMTVWVYTPHQIRFRNRRQRSRWLPFVRLDRRLQSKWKT